MTNRSLHDGIVGALVLVCTVLGLEFSPLWYWVPLILGALLLQSALTGFCPLYSILNKINPEN